MKNLIKGNKGKIISGLSLIVCVTIFLAQGINKTGHPAYAGNFILWEDVKDKSNYAQKLLNDGTLVNMHFAEIIEKLGNPVEQSETSIYYIIPTFGADRTYFNIYFDKEGIFKSGNIEQG